MDKKEKGKKVYESIDELCQEMAKYAVNSRKSKLIEEIENDLEKCEKKKKENKNINIDSISNSNNNNNISNSNSNSNSSNKHSDSSLKIKSKSSSNNFSSKECSRETPKNKLDFPSKKNEKDKCIKNILTKVNINKNKTQKLHNSTKNNIPKNNIPKNNESTIRNSSTYKMRSLEEISNFKKPKNVSFSVDKKSSNKLNIYNDINDKKDYNINKKEIKRKIEGIKGDLDNTVSPIEEKDKEESEKNMPIVKNTFSGKGILKKNNRSTDFTAAFFNMHDSISKLIIKSGNDIDNKKNKKNKSKFNSFVVKEDNNKIDNYYVKINKDYDKKDKSAHDDDNDNDIKSFDSEKSFKTTYNKGKKKKNRLNDDIKLNKTFISFDKNNVPENSDLKLKSNKSLYLCDVTEGLIKYIDSSSKTNEEDENENENENEDESKNSKSSSVDNNNQTIFKNSISISDTNSENDSSITNSSNNQNKPSNNLLLHYYKNSKMKQYKNFLDKQLKRQRLTQIKIDKKRKQKELKEIQSCYLSPKINSISLEIIEGKGNYIPLFKRAVELENERKMKLLIKQKIKDKNFIANNSNLSRRTKKQISDFFCAQMDWKDKIEKKNKDLKNQLKKKERQNNSEVINYKMKINPKSELIVSTLRKNDSTYNESISINKSNSIINNSIRLYNDYKVRQKKLTKLRMELTPSFKPMIKKIPLSFYSGNNPKNKKIKEHFNKIAETKDDNSNNCILYRNKSPITIKPQKSRNKNQEIINHIDSEVDQKNQKENNLKSTAVDSKNTKSIQKNTLDIIKSNQNIEQSLLNKINSKDKEEKSNINKSNYNSQKNENNISDINIDIQIKENNKINNNSKSMKTTIDNNSINKNNKINSLKNLSNKKTTTKNSITNKNNNKNKKNNIIKIFQAIKQTKQVENSKKKMSVKLLSNNDKRTSQKNVKIYTTKDQFKGPFYRFSISNKNSSELFLDQKFNDINDSNKTPKDENDSLNEFFNCENIKKVKKNKIEKTILKNFKFNSSDEEEEEEEKSEIEDTESINENNKIKYISWKQKLKEISKMKNNNKNINSETSPQTKREIKDKKKINLNGDKLYMINVRNSSSTGNLKPYIISENTEIFYKFFVKNKNIC